jgi:hypothetical protein
MAKLEVVGFMSALSSRVARWADSGVYEELPQWISRKLMINRGKREINRCNRLIHLQLLAGVDWVKCLGTKGSSEEKHIDGRHRPPAAIYPV